MVKQGRAKPGMEVKGRCMSISALSPMCPAKAGCCVPVTATGSLLQQPILQQRARDLPQHEINQDKAGSASDKSCLNPGGRRSEVRPGRVRLQVPPPAGVGHEERLPLSIQLTILATWAPAAFACQRSLPPFPRYYALVFLPGPAALHPG